MTYSYRQLQQLLKIGREHFSLVTPKLNSKTDVLFGYWVGLSGELQQSIINFESGNTGSKQSKEEEHKEYDESSYVYTQMDSHARRFGQLVNAYGDVSFSCNVWAAQTPNHKVRELLKCAFALGYPKVKLTVRHNDLCKKACEYLLDWYNKHQERYSKYSNTKEEAKQNKQEYHQESVSNQHEKKACDSHTINGVDIFKYDEHDILFYSICLELLGTDELTQKRTFKQLAFEYHPDRGGQTHIMQRINVMYDKVKSHWTTKAA
jgi:hypothetical protein